MALALLQPWIFMSISVYYLLTTILKLLVTLDFRTLFSRRALNDAWFGAFWVFMGPQARQGAIAWVEALLHGRIKDGRITTKPSMPPIHGVILEIGAGSGMWTSVLADVAHAPGGAIRKIYGVEPNPISAAALKKRAADVGLGATYEVIPAGIEDLQKEASIEPGSIDCIMTVHCLCSIPEPEKNIRLLYNYLKEGGRWYVYEHVRCEKGTLVPLIQKFTNIPWKRTIGSCRLCRPTGDWIIQAGSWDSVDIASCPDASAYELVPHVAGSLVKASKA